MVQFLGYTIVLVTGFLALVLVGLGVAFIVWMSEESKRGWALLGYVPLIVLCVVIGVPVLAVVITRLMEEVKRVRRGLRSEADRHRKVMEVVDKDPGFEAFYEDWVNRRT